MDPADDILRLRLGASEPPRPVNVITLFDLGRGNLMGQLVMLILPAPAHLDTIRGCLTGKFDLNPKVDGLGDAEELQATNKSGCTTIFEHEPGPVSEVLRTAMRQRSLASEDFDYFWVRYGWATSESALLCAAETLHGWLYDTWNRVLSAQEFRESISLAGRPVG